MLPWLPKLHTGRCASDLRRHSVADLPSDVQSGHWHGAVPAPRNAIVQALYAGCLGGPRPHPRDFEIRTGVALSSKTPHCWSRHPAPFQALASTLVKRRQVNEKAWFVPV
jgi:hypothetical protein